jgi:hypothetical protein
MMMYPKFKVGDLVRSKWARGSAALGIICSEDTDESSLLGTYYRIFYFEDNEEIWGHPRDWDLVE